MELEPEVSTAILMTKLCCVTAKNTTQSELSRGLRQLDEYQNIYSLRYHVSLWSSRTYRSFATTVSQPKISDFFFFQEKRLKVLKCYTFLWVQTTTTDHVRNEEVLLIVNEQRNILHEIRKRKANWIGHILRRNCLLQQVIEGKIKGQIEATRRRGRRGKKLLDDLKDRRGYCQLKEEALDRTIWRNRFGGGFGPVVWQITDDNDDDTLMHHYFRPINSIFRLLIHACNHPVSHHI